MDFKHSILIGSVVFVTCAGAATVLAAHSEVFAEETYSDSSGSPEECTTVRPGPGWVCVGGGWYPPDMTPPGGQPPAAAVPSSGSRACTTVQPGPDWVCSGGGWYPPGMAPPGPAYAALSAPVAASGACTTVQPGPGWSCAGGGWYPPGLAPATGAATSTSAAPPQSTDCATVRPGPDWTCANGGWYPPGMIASAPPAQGGASAPAVGGARGRLRVMTWNIHFGGGDPWGQAHVIANSGADVALLQEAETWSEHMPTTYVDRLQQLTGQRWQAVWSGTANPDCAYGCQGNLILSRLPIVESHSVLLSGATPSWAAVVVGGVRVNLFNVHLEWADTGLRTTQLLQFMDWMRQFAGPRLAGGDYNSWWGEWWIAQMETEYTDTWRDVTGSVEGGYTLNRAVRFDYLFRSHDGHSRVRPVDSWVHWTHLSDHGALIADYTVH